MRAAHHVGSGFICRLFCVVFCAAFVLLYAPVTANAEGDSSGSITGSLNAFNHDVTMDYPYSEDYFRLPQNEYHHGLARLSLGLSLRDSSWPCGTSSLHCLWQNSFPGFWSFPLEGRRPNSSGPGCGQLTSWISLP